MISRNQGAWLSRGTASERDLRLPRLHASMLRGEIRLQILRYHMMHHKDGSFFGRVVVVKILLCELKGQLWAFLQLTSWSIKVNLLLCLLRLHHLGFVRPIAIAHTLLSTLSSCLCQCQWPLLSSTSCSSSLVSSSRFPWHLDTQTGCEAHRIFKVLLFVFI